VRVSINLRTNAAAMSPNKAEDETIGDSAINASYFMYNRTNPPAPPPPPPMLGNKDIKSLQELSKLSHNILVHYSTFVVIVGTVFNMLNFACFYRMKKRNSQNIYLGALSLADFFNIQINILVPMLLNMEGIQKMLVPYVTKSTCIVYGYLVEVGLLMPVWIMVVLAAERFCSIIWPLKKNVFSTRQHAKRTLLILLSIVLLWSLFKIKTPGKF
jgi:hypothetical protein